MVERGTGRVSPRGFAIGGVISARVERAFAVSTQRVRVVMRGLDPRIQDGACVANHNLRRLGARIKSGRDAEKKKSYVLRILR